MRGRAGSSMPATFISAAVLSHALRVPRWAATIVATIVVAWQAVVVWGVWNERADGLARVGPGNLAGRLALWGISQRGIDVIAVVVAKVDQEQRDPLVPGVGVGLGDEDAEVGARAVGDEELRARDQVVVAVADRLGPDPGDVGDGIRLGDTEAADILALDAGDEIALFLLVRSEQVDGHRPE